MKVVLEICDVEFKTFDIPEDSPTSEYLAMTVNNDDGKILLMRFRHTTTEKGVFKMVLDSAFTPTDEHINGIESIVKAGNGEE